MKETHAGPTREHRRQKRSKKNWFVRFSLLGHFQRMRSSPCAYLGRNDTLFSWKSLFFYRCTDEILFAPLKSQGADSRLKYIRENTVEAAPPPCSPKSIYVLANLVRRPLTKQLQHVTDTSISAGNQAPLRRCPGRHQKQSDLEQRCRRSFLVDQRHVRAISRPRTALC